MLLLDNAYSVQRQYIKSRNRRVPICMQCNLVMQSLSLFTALF